MTPIRHFQSRLLAAAGLYSLLFFSTPTEAATLQFPSRDTPSYGQTYTYDYVIVGSGPGGSVMAHRLTENPNITVAVIEAGTWTENTVGNLSTVPGYNGAYDLVDPAASTYPDDWGFITTPQTGMNGLRTRYMRGKCLGGSSNLNAMAWLDNPTGVFQKWADEVGDQSWEFSTVTKYFAKAMNFTPPAASRIANSTPMYNPADTSQGGPLSVTYTAYAYAWSTWLGVALQAIGMPHVDGFINAGRPLNGSTWLLSTINHATGERASADRAYLRPILSRPNLHIYQQTFAERILFGKNATATGVAVTQNNGNNKLTLNAKREVIVAAGVFQSPQLLQVSGIGPRAALQAQGIPVVVDRPGVGQNLQDQYYFSMSYRANLEPVFPVSGGSPSAVRAAALYNKNRTGPLSSSGAEYVGYEKIPKQFRSGFSPSTEAVLSKYPSDWPEGGYLMVPTVTGNGRNTTTPPANEYFGTIFGLIMAPTSIGNVSISSSSMHTPPNINPNWLGTQADLELGIALFKRVRQAFGVLQNRSIAIGQRYFPDASVQLNTDAQIGNWLRGNIDPIYHAAATNKMGKASDPMAVIDPKGRVYGANNLRISDISAFPFLVPGTAPQASVYMLSEKISDDVKAAQLAGSFW